MQLGSMSDVWTAASIRRQTVERTCAFATTEGFSNVALLYLSCCDDKRSKNEQDAHFESSNSALWASQNKPGTHGGDARFADVPCEKICQEVLYQCQLVGLNSQKSHLRQEAFSLTPPSKGVSQ